VPEIWSSAKPQALGKGRVSSSGRGAGGDLGLEVPDEAGSRCRSRFDAPTSYSDAEVRAVCGCYQAEMGAAGGGGFQWLRLGGGNGGL